MSVSDKSHVKGATDLNVKKVIKEFYVMNVRRGIVDRV